MAGDIDSPYIIILVEHVSVHLRDLRGDLHKSAGAGIPVSPAACGKSGRSRENSGTAAKAEDRERGEEDHQQRADRPFVDVGHGVSFHVNNLFIIISKNLPGAIIHSSLWECPCVLDSGSYRSSGANRFDRQLSIQYTKNEFSAGSSETGWKSPEFLHGSASFP